MTVIHDNLGNPIDSANPLPVDISTSDATVPIDLQSHLQSTIQMHNAVSVAASTISDSSFIDTNGFSEVNISLLNDAATSSTMHIFWSHDGSTTHGITLNVINGSAQQQPPYNTKLMARYVKIRLANNDTIAHTMSSWAYLTA